MASVFHDLVKKKIKAFRGKYPQLHSAHEGIGLLDEEFSELRKETYRRKRMGDPHRFMNELVDIAAYCEIWAEDMREWRKGRNHR